jgi:microcystin degradation protein MlrC
MGVIGRPAVSECFEELEGRLVEQLRAAGPLDGMYFCLHGAMGVSGIADPETRLLRAVRSVIGGAPLVTSHDLHGNVTQARIDAVDATRRVPDEPAPRSRAIGRKAARS